MGRTTRSGAGWAAGSAALCFMFLFDGAAGSGPDHPAAEIAAPYESIDETLGPMRAII